MVDPSYRQADDAKVAALDTLDKLASDTLYRVGARLVERLATADVGLDLLFADRSKLNVRLLDGHTALVRFEQTDACQDIVRAARQQREHASGIFAVTWFAESDSVGCYDGVSPKD